MLERKLANIYIPDVSLGVDEELIKASWQIHCQQKILFKEMIDGDCDSEEILEALEVFIGTQNMDGYLLDIEPQIEQFAQSYNLQE